MSELLAFLGRAPSARFRSLRIQLSIGTSSAHKLRPSLSVERATEMHSFPLSICDIQRPNVPRFVAPFSLERLNTKAQPMRTTLRGRRERNAEADTGHSQP